MTCEAQQPKNTFMHGYDAAYEEILNVARLGLDHQKECPGCPPCEVVNEVVRKFSPGFSLEALEDVMLGDTRRRRH